jgi:hypothetical protein
MRKFKVIFIFYFYQEGYYLIRIKYIINKFHVSERTCFAIDGT